MDTSRTRPPTLEQRRAKHAWGVIQRLARLQQSSGDKNSQVDKYAREAKKLPIRIINSGLGQSLAFLLAKSKENGNSENQVSLASLHHDLTDWVIRERPLTGAARGDHLLQSIVEGDAEFLRRATDEVMAYLQWLNRFAEAEGLAKGDD